MPDRKVRRQIGNQIFRYVGIYASDETQFFDFFVFGYENKWKKLKISLVKIFSNLMMQKKNS